LSPRWQAKIECNRARDMRSFRLLRRMGWTVIRVWEHQIEQSADSCIARVAAIACRLRQLFSESAS
jgi:DNA mismatch endonuclease (patch repair protein)